MSYAGQVYVSSNAKKKKEEKKKGKKKNVFYTVKTQGDAMRNILPSLT